NFIDYEYNSKFMLPVYNVEHIFPVKNSKTGFEFQLTYRILLGTSFPLSSLNIAILGTFGELKNKAIEPISFIRKINIIDDENFTVEQVLIEKLNFTSHKYFSLYLKLSTLAFFIARDFFIDVGFIGGLNIINSSFDASYFYQRIKRTYDGTEHITVEEMRQEPSYKTSSEIYNFYFSPQIDFNYNFYPIGLQLSLGYDFASLKLGYLFNL
ncbi:MAG: hypothetical protein JXA68_09915, partial [Ignavibacteriales bacterium]|nr:hypothetical protein [Ignavibacteriales bacterium]